MSTDTGAATNTDRELWREHEGDFYADSLFVTASGGIGINVGGHVIVKPIRDWFATAAAPPVPQAGADASPPRSGYVRRWSYEKGAYVYVEKEPQAGEVATSVPPDVVQRWRAQMSRPHIIIRDIQGLGTEMADMLTAQAAEIERQRSHIRAQVEDMDTLAAALAAKDEEIARLKTALGAAEGDVICWHNRVEQAQARQQELEAALQPFANLAASYDGDERMSGYPDGFVGWSLGDARITLGDLRQVRAALAPAGKAAPGAAPKPAGEMSDHELQADFTEHCHRWDKVFTDRDGHSGSPGEWIVERLDKLQTEAKRRGLALVEPPTPAGKEVKP